MKVQELERIVRTGDIIVTRNDFKWNKPLSYLSTLIRIFGKVEYNHAKMVIVERGRVFTNEALESGIVQHELGLRMRGKSFKLLRPRFPINKYLIADRANSRIGLTKYDFMGLIYQAIYLTTGKWIGHGRSNSKHRMYCFEYVAWVYRKIYLRWYRITPDEIINSKHLRTILEETLD